MLNRVLPVVAFAVAVIVLGSGAVAEPAPPVSECDLCLAVAQDDPYACLGRVSAITTNEEDIYARIRLEGPFYEPHEVTVRWFNPAGELFHEQSVGTPLPSSAGYELWEYYMIWRGIRIAGSPASEMPGEWQVVVLVDGEERCTKTFTISLSQQAADTLSASVRECLTIDRRLVRDSPGAPAWMQIEVGPEAAGFRYEILYDTEKSGGTFAGQEIELGPHARSLEVGGELDESGAAAINISWPGDELTYFFQVLIATNVLELVTGSFWQSNVVQVDRPAEEAPIASNGSDKLIGGHGDDYMFGCVSDSSVVIEDCFELQLSPAGLVAGPESSLNLTLEGEGFVTVTPTAETHNEAASYVAYLPVDLPLRPCCEELELTALAICYESATNEDYIDSIQIGYLSDGGSFEELEVIEDDLLDSSWDCAFFPFNEVVIPRPLVIRIWFVFGGAAPGPAAPAAAVAGMRLGNIRVVLAPRRNTPWAGHSSSSVNITCAKLLTCMPGSGTWTISSGPQWSCAGGFTWYCGAYSPEPKVVGFLFESHCEEEITFGKIQVLDEEGAVVWQAVEAAAGRLSFDSPYVKLGSWPWGSGYSRQPPGNYEVVLQTSIGEFRKKFTIEYRCE